MKLLRMINVNYKTSVFNFYLKNEFVQRICNEYVSTEVKLWDY
jgi:hypothetical protein